MTKYELSMIIHVTLTVSQVVGEAQGTDESLQKLKQDLNEGPRHAHVVKLEWSGIDSKENENSFSTA